MFAAVRGVLSACGLAVMLGLVAACSRQQACALPDEPPRVLDLTRDGDRTHLASDLATVDRLARAYGRWAAAHPPNDTRFVSLDLLQQHARAYCQALLAEKISATHGIDLPRLERAFEDRQTQLSQR